MNQSPLRAAAAARVVSSCLVLGLALAGCAGAPGRAPQQAVALAGPGPMPPPLPERVPRQPHRPARLVWEPGHYLRDAVGYTWHPGHYVTRAAPRARFVHGHWEMRGTGWAWVAGRWV